MSACKGYVKPSYFKLLLSFIIHQIILFVCDWCKHVMWLILGNIKHLMTGPLGNGEFCFPRISMFPLTSCWETLTFSGNKIHCSPRDQSLSVYYSPPTEWIMRKPNKNEMAGVNSRFASVSESEILKDTRRCSTRENKEGHEIWNESFQR